MWGVWGGEFSTETLFLWLFIIIFTIKPENALIEEDDAKKPINPYGETKLVIENLLHW